MLEAVSLPLAATADLVLAPPRRIFSVTAYAGAQGALETALGLFLPEAGRTRRAAGVFWLWSGPQSWLAMAPARWDLSTAAPHAAITDQSDGKAIFLVQARRAREKLQKLIPVDVHETVFLADHTALTLAGHIPIQLWREDDNFALACFRSYASALHHALLEA